MSSSLHGSDSAVTTTPSCYQSVTLWLSLLYVCHRTKEEIDQTWISQVLFHFDDQRTALSKVSLMPPITRSRIRQMRIGNSLAYSSFSKKPNLHHQIVPEMFEGFRLDRHTIFVQGSPPWKACLHEAVFKDALILTVLVRPADLDRDVRDFIKKGRGWKQLDIIHKMADFTPGDVQKILKRRARKHLSLSVNVQNILKHKVLVQKILNRRLGKHSSLSVNVHVPSSRKLGIWGGLEVFDPADDVNVTEDAPDYLELDTDSEHLTVVFTIKRSFETEDAPDYLELHTDSEHLKVIVFTFRRSFEMCEQIDEVSQSDYRGEHHEAWAQHKATVMRVKGQRQEGKTVVVHYDDYDEPDSFQGLLSFRPLSNGLEPRVRTGRVQPIDIPEWKMPEMFLSHATGASEEWS